MEEFLVVLFQFLFEVVLQVLAELPWDAFVGSREIPSPKEWGGWQWGALSFFAGLAVGGLSLIFLPNTLLRSGGVRMINLLVAPTMSGLVAFTFSNVQKSRSKSKGADPSLRAVCAACFTLALALIRFTYATRPGK